MCGAHVSCDLDHEEMELIDVVSSVKTEPELDPEPLHTRGS